MLSCVQMSTYPAVRIDPRQAASQKYTMQLLCELTGTVLYKETGDLLEYQQLIQHPEHQEFWGAHHGKEIGRLAQGLPGIIEGTVTIEFISTIFLNTVA